MCERKRRERGLGKCRGVYSSIIPPRGGGRNQRFLMLGKKIKEECKTRAGKESEREGEREGFGQRKKKEKKIRVEKQMKEKKIGGEGNEENGQGGQCKRIEKL